MTRLDLTRLDPAYALQVARSLTRYAHEGLWAKITPRVTFQDGELYDGSRLCPRCGEHSRVLSSRILGPKPPTSTQIEHPERDRLCLDGHRWTAVEYEPTELALDLLREERADHPGVSGLRVLEAEWQMSHGLQGEWPPLPCWGGRI